MGTVALDPQRLVTDVAGNAHRLDATEPPGMLSRPVGGGEPLPPVRQQAGLTGLHAHWARVHGADRAGGAPKPVGGGAAGGGGVRAAVRSRVTAAAVAVASPAQRDDRALIGSLIRAVDALATRCDELSEKVADLESVLGEIVDSFGADLAAIRAAVAPHAAGAEPPDG